MTCLICGCSHIERNICAGCGYDYTEKEIPFLFPLEHQTKATLEHFYAANRAPRSSHAPSDEYSLRFQKLPSVAIGLDITKKEGTVAYCDSQHAIYTKSIVLQWDTWRMDSPEDALQLQRVFQQIKQEFIERKIGMINAAALVVPYIFSCSQKEKIRQVAKEVGIDILSMDCAGIYASVDRYTSITDAREEFMDLVCVVDDTSYEISLINTGDSVFDSYGTVALSFSGSWKNLSREAMEKKLNSELRQFLRDVDYAPFFGDPDFSTVVFRVILSGQRSPMLEALLRQLTGIRPIIADASPAVGALLHAMALRGIDLRGEFVLVQTQNRNIWARLGEAGEQAMFVARYTSIPTRKSARLLLSTQTRLEIYEGNYLNPAYDHLLSFVELGALDVREGEEVQLDLAIDSKNSLMLQIQNPRGTVLYEGPLPSIP